jgi:hypothetical protein
LFNGVVTVAAVMPKHLRPSRSQCCGLESILLTPEGI